MTIQDLLIVFALIFFLFGVDDLIIDVIAHIRRIRPRRLEPKEVLELALRPEKNIAIIVPAWHEGGIIRQMLQGNSQRIEYSRYHFFVGVYPNDPDTVEA